VARGNQRLSKAASLRWRGVVGVGVAFGDAGGGDGEGGAGGEVLPGGGEEFEFVEAAGEALGSGEADVAGAGNGPGLFGAEGGDGRAVAGAEGRLRPGRVGPWWIRVRRARVSRAVLACCWRGEEGLVSSAGGGGGDGAVGMGDAVEDGGEASSSRVVGMGSNLWSWQRAQLTVRPRKPRRRWRCDVVEVVGGVAGGSAARSRVPTVSWSRRRGSWRRLRRWGRRRQEVAGELFDDEAVEGEVLVEGADDVVAVAPGVGADVVVFVAVWSRRSGRRRASGGPSVRRSGGRRGGGR
jgi:hypothetical protein